MKRTTITLSVLFVFFVLSVTVYSGSVSAQSIPSWIKNTALWYGQGDISKAEFLGASNDNTYRTSNIIIPNGNANIGHTGFYIPLNLEVKEDTTVVWVNEDTVPHTVQSIDEKGNIIGLFNSAPLDTGERFAYTFEKEGTYNYFCSLHPWRVGVVTVR